MDTNEPGREPTEPTDAERFERWWNDEGSGIAPYDGEEHCFHAERVSRIAWLNGAYFAQARVAELEAGRVMGDKAPCRWVKPTGLTGQGFIREECRHPLTVHLSPFGGCCQPALCHGCPCHEPEPAKDTTQKGDGDAVATD